MFQFLNFLTLIISPKQKGYIHNIFSNGHRHDIIDKQNLLINIMIFGNYYLSFYLSQHPVNRELCGLYSLGKVKYIVYIYIVYAYLDVQ